MTHSRRTPPLRRAPVRRIGEQPRGAAVLLALFLTVCLGAVAVSAITLTSSANMVTKYYDRERDFRYAAEAGLALGRSRIAKDTTIHLPDSGYVKLLDSVTVTDARNVVMPRTRVTVYAGRSGNVTGQFGDFVTLIAKADDGNSTRYVRRLELVGENFARFAMFTNTWQAGLCYGNGEFIRGLGWSNQQWQSCSGQSPTYFDTIGAVLTVNGGNPVFKKGPLSAKSNQSPIPLPTVSRLANLPNYASQANLSFTPTAGRLMRMEFEAVDVDANGDSTGVDEGFLRVYRANSAANAAWYMRLPTWDVTGTTAPTKALIDSVCGDFHGGKFYPAAVHNQDWFVAAFPTANDKAAQKTAGTLLQDAESDKVLANSTARCYPAGDPHLVAVERDSTQKINAGTGVWKNLYSGVNAPWHKGGEDTTFTVHGRWGTWDSLPTAPGTTVTSSTHARNEAYWLFPLGKGLNPGYRGVAYVNGDVLLSGQLRSRLTLYASGQVTFIDDVMYVSPPNAPGQDCFAANANMLGIIAVDSIMIDQNVLNRPQRWWITAGGGSAIKYLNGSGQDFKLHGVLMSLTRTVGVYGYDKGPTSAATSNCVGSSFSGGCIAQVGGVIEQSISATYAGSGTGFAENRQVDQCMMVTSPPYFPTTGRYFNNRYYEFDPARFNPVLMYQALQSGV
jgi:hypothetical protein